MKIKLLIASLFLTLSTVYAQKVKIKKGLVTIDQVEYAKVDNEFNNKVVKTLDDKNIVVLKKHSFEKPNPVKRNPRSKAPYKPTVTVSYYVVSFLDFELEFETKLSVKKLMKAFQSNQVINSDNLVSEENAKKMAKLISEDVSGTRQFLLVR